MKGVGAVMGLDLSFTGSGIVVLTGRWEPGDWERELSYYRLGSAGELAGRARVKAIVTAVREWAEEYCVFQAFYEQHAFSAGLLQHAFGRAELVGAVRWELDKLGVPTEPVVASSARKLLFGKLPRMSRKEVKALVGHELGKMGAPFQDEDTRDAFVVANAGWSQLGRTALIHPDQG